MFHSWNVPSDCKRSVNSGSTAVESMTFPSLSPPLTGKVLRCKHLARGDCGPFFLFELLSSVEITSIKINHL